MDLGDMKSKDLGKLMSGKLHEGKDMGNMKSRDIGELTTAGLVSKAKTFLEKEGYTPEAVVVPEKGHIPGTIKGQNLGHNAKKEGLGGNTKR